MRKTPVILAVAAIASAGAGSATAASLITGKQIKNGTVTGADIKNHSLTSRDFRGSVRGPAGPMGAAGATGATGPAGARGPTAIASSSLIRPEKVEGTAVTVAPGATADFVALCPAVRPVALSGGYSVSGGNPVMLEDHVTDGLTGWVGRVRNTSAFTAFVVRPSVVCAELTPL